MHTRMLDINSRSWRGYRLRTGNFSPNCFSLRGSGNELPPPHCSQGLSTSVLCIDSYSTFGDYIKTLEMVSIAVRSSLAKFLMCITEIRCACPNVVARIIIQANMSVAGYNAYATRRATGTCPRYPSPTIQSSTHLPYLPSSALSHASSRYTSVRSASGPPSFSVLQLVLSGGLASR